MIFNYKKQFYDDWNLRQNKKQKFINKYIDIKLKKKLEKMGYSINKCTDKIFQQYPSLQFDFTVVDKYNKPKIAFLVCINSIKTQPLILSEFKRESGIKSAVLSVCNKSNLKKFYSNKVILLNSNEKSTRADLFLFMYLKPSKKQTNELIKKILQLL